MKFFDKEDSYWGNETDKILGSGSDRFTLRSVKFVVDGMLTPPIILVLQIIL